MEKSAFATPADYVLANATNKALEVAGRLMLASLTDGSKPPDLVVGSDTIVVLDGRILEKPEDAPHAFEMLQALSGRGHEVFTAVALILPNVADDTTGTKPMIKSFAERTEVFFAPLSDTLINAYIATGDPMDKAGSYGIQGAAGSFVRAINGCYFNVMGFPQHRFATEVADLLHRGVL
eukprot:CAMPEP_0196657554 /NCGR_PEP_ID=MMETSP1086-20130531/24135_1 /TAXON_ID=77921 /ORGANISM="Cyanoptyche  gloeocystis , Strain SAG4.97" /LENGTH=178 /DNA_ID=CAMNT_0041990735 /DNA_START=179 /DNA_END=715 /DNA_ORIENTATION=+